jgi:hypothetical protein
VTIALSRQIGGTDLAARRLAHQVLDQQLNAQVGDRIATLNLETRDEGQPRAFGSLLAVDNHLVRFGR